MEEEQYNIVTLLRRNEERERQEMDWKRGMKERARQEIVVKTKKRNKHEGEKERRNVVQRINKVSI